MPDAGAGEESDFRLATLTALLRSELGAGILGLRLFVASVAVASAMLGAVWMLGVGITEGLRESGKALLGGDIALTVIASPLTPDAVANLAQIGRVSHTVELRTTAQAGALRTPVELKTVDAAYPLYGAVAMDRAGSLADALAVTDGLPGTVVEASLLARLGIERGDTVRFGSKAFRVMGILRSEPDRLSAGRFLVGPRVLIGQAQLSGADLIGPGALVEYRYRLRLPEGTGPDIALEAVRALEPAQGWELERPQDAGDRVRRTAERATSFLGVAGLVAVVIGLAGAWTAAAVWVSRRGRTIALYRLSGATPSTVVALHAVIIAIAGMLGLVAGFALATAVAISLMDLVAARLQLVWDPVILAGPGLRVAAAMAFGLAGASAAALSTAARTPPAAAMRDVEGAIAAAPRHVVMGATVIVAAVAFAVASLPMPWLAAIAATGLALVAGLLGLAGWGLARLASRREPSGFFGVTVRNGLAAPGAAATKALAVGVGIAGITAIVAAQSSLEHALRGELPAKVPDLILIDVQPHQVAPLRAKIAAIAELGGVQATPFMRATILAVNGVPAGEALVDPDKSWVIEGDRSFSWSAEPTGAELLAGQWWPPDYAGPPMLSAEEDVFEAFDLKPGDRLTYGVLGRRFTSEVTSIRKEYHRTFRPEFLLVASPVPFRDAPHSWIFSLQGETDAAIDRLMAELGTEMTNVTSIDIRRLVAQVTDVIDSVILGSLAVAATLLLTGALSLAAVVTADVDARRREALAFTLVGASRREIALARLAEAAVVGVFAALLGGIAGLAGGYWLTDEALHVDWAPGILALMLPGLLGLVAALTAGAAGGIGALPRGRGAIARQLGT